MFFSLMSIQIAVENLSLGLLKLTFAKPLLTSVQSDSTVPFAISLTPYIVSQQFQPHTSIIISELSETF